ncbi:MAG: toll/interleukin-1 receptor domain-containing protein [Gammaproteobacteria bacterium]|nr:toll/interleukin-1 receptor domain-containing protein [Gammaproteobacteria bacterium]
MQFSVNLVLALVLIITSLLALRPTYLYKKAQEKYKVLPPKAVKHQANLRQTIFICVTGAVISFIAVWKGWTIPPLILIFAFIYCLMSNITTFVLWRSIGRILSLQSVHSRGWHRTPYAEIVVSKQTKEPRVHPKDKVFDIFISYKSEDVNNIRRIVDMLLAGGLTVWFNDYIVLLADWMEMKKAKDQKEHDRLIDNFLLDGIRKATRGVVFSNNRFIKSDWCKLELNQLFSPQGPGFENIIEVKIPHESDPHRFQPLLAECPSMEFSGDFNKVLRFIQKQFDLPGEFSLTSIQTNNVTSNIFQDRKLGCSFDISGWDVVSQGGTQVRGGIRGPDLKCTIDKYLIKMNLFVGTGVVAPRPGPQKGAIINERDSFKESAQFAYDFMSHFGNKCFGVHMMFLHKFSHLVLTYWLQNCWARRYSIILPNPRTGESTEFAFVFGFYGPFKEYCRNTHIMDHLVSSLKWL